MKISVQRKRDNFEKDGKFLGEPTVLISGRSKVTKLVSNSHEK